MLLSVAAQVLSLLLLAVAITVAALTIKPKEER
jgi:hypothetical protein